MRDLRALHRCLPPERDQDGDVIMASSTTDPTSSANANASSDSNMSASGGSGGGNGGSARGGAGGSGGRPADPFAGPQRTRSITRVSSVSSTDMLATVDLSSPSAAEAILQPAPSTPLLRPQGVGTGKGGISSWLARCEAGAAAAGPVELPADASIPDAPADLLVYWLYLFELPADADVAEALGKAVAAVTAAGGKAAVTTEDTDTADDHKQLLLEVDVSNMWPELRVYCNVWRQATGLVVSCHRHQDSGDEDSAPAFHSVYRMLQRVCGAGPAAQ